MSAVIDLCDSDDEMMIIAESPPPRSGGAAAAAAPILDEDAALALRLQEEEWGYAVQPAGGVAAEHVSPLEQYGDDDPQSPDEYGRRARREQDRAYEESLAADRKREVLAARNAPRPRSRVRAGRAGCRQ
jgi:hypothetical protein